MAKKSRKQYSIHFKVKVVKEYLAQPRGKGIDVLKKYDINTSVICNWVNAYKEGRLEYENTIATAKAKPKVMLINGEKYVEYILVLE